MTVTDTDREVELVSKLRMLYQQARDNKKRRYDNWTRNWRLVNNRYGGTTTTWMPQPKDSQIYPVCSSLVGWMTDQKVSFEISPAVDPNNTMFPFHLRMAQDLETVMAANWKVENYDRAKRLTIWDAVIYGAGIFKSVWDGSLHDGYGNANLVRVDPWSFYPDPSATSETDADYFIEVKKMSLDEFERRYPHARMSVEAADILVGNDPIDARPDLVADTDRTPKANPGALPGGNTRYNAPSSGRDYYSSEGVIVYEFWLRQNERGEGDESDIHDEWRLVVVAKNQIVMDETADELWDCGRHPYTRFVFDDLGTFWGVSLVDHLAHPQIYINRLLTAMQHSAELVGNPIFLEPSNSGLDRVGIINRPGQRLRVNTSAMSGAGQSKPDWLRPPEMSDGVRALVEYWGARMQKIAGLDALELPNQRQGERTVQQAQEAAFVRVRDAQRNLEMALRESGELLVNLVIENYTVPRIVAMVGPTGEKTALALSGRHFWAPSHANHDHRKEGAIPLKFQLQVNAGASRPSSRAQRDGQAQILRGLSAIDVLSMLEMMEIPNADKIYQRLLKEAEAGLGQPGARQRARKR